MKYRVSKVIETETLKQYLEGNLVNIIIPDGLKIIGSSAFNGYSSLTSITIPDSVTKINPGAFGNCSSLTEFKFNGTVEQWESIILVGDWKYNSPFNEVICLDGMVSL